MKHNTLSELGKVLNDLYEIQDVARSNCGDEGYDSITKAIRAVQEAWNVCKRGMEAKGLHPVTNARKIKSGYSNNPDYFGDWYGKGQIDFDAIINPDDEGDVWMVKMWSGSGYALDVYLCKATNVHDAIDIVFNWSWENEGHNNMVFDYEYISNECRKEFEKYPDYFGEDLSDDYETFEDKWFSEYESNDSYDLFAREENFFVGKVPEEVLAENRK